MRITLNLSFNKVIVPYDYQSKLVGVFHKWIGKDNNLHDTVSLYSFSWFSKGEVKNKGLNFPNGTTWSINSHDDFLIKKIINEIQNGNDIMPFGMQINSIYIQENLAFYTPMI